MRIRRHCGQFYRLSLRTVTWGFDWTAYASLVISLLTHHSLMSFRTSGQLWVKAHCSTVTALNEWRPFTAGWTKRVLQSTAWAGLEPALFSTRQHSPKSVPLQSLLHSCYFIVSTSYSHFTLYFVFLIQTYFRFHISCFILYRAFFSVHT